MSIENEIAAPHLKDDGQRHRAADDVFQHVVELIDSGVLAEGAPLPSEREISETCAVSRTVVREAVLALSNKGLIDARPGYRPIVRKANYDTAFETVDSVVSRLLMQPGGIRNLFDTRIMIEASLVRQAAAEAGKNDIAALQNALNANEAAIDDSERFYQTDIAFHAALFEVPQNPLMPAIHKAYTSWLAPQWSQMPRLPDRNRSNFIAHKEIFDAILMRDPDRAEHALRNHLAAAWTQVEQSFGEN